MVFFNFRADRARQMTRAIAEPGFEEFADRAAERFCLRGDDAIRQELAVAALLLAREAGTYSGAGVHRMGFRNLRCAETEKYAHVTYFFNGGVEKPFPGEERILVASPKVATYDLKPEMSAAGITDTVVHAIEKGDFDAIIMNFANADMVGHSGS